MRNHTRATDEPISEDLLQRLYHALEKRYPGKVRRMIEVTPLAVAKTIDNAADARETLRRLQEAEDEEISA